MTMVIRHGTEWVEITLRELGPGGTPSEGDIGVNVAAAGGAFAGRNDTVWIGRDEWAGFLEDLAQLERTRRGEARVAAMSPEEFQLVVFAADRAGHLAAEGWVGREYAVRGGVTWMRDRVSFSLKIDPGGLPDLIQQFQALSPAG